MQDIQRNAAKVNLGVDKTGGRGSYRADRAEFEDPNNGQSQNLSKLTWRWFPLTSA